MKIEKATVTKGKECLKRIDLLLVSIGGSVKFRDPRSFYLGTWPLNESLNTQIALG